MEQTENTLQGQVVDLISIVSRLKDCTFIFAGIVFLFYVTGFIIVGMHLLSKGIGELEIAKARYVSVGITFWVITGGSIKKLPRQKNPR